MRPSRTAFQRLALAALVVCAVLVGARLLNGESAADVRAGARDGYAAVTPADRPPAGTSAETVAAEVTAQRPVAPSPASPDRGEVLYEEAFPFRPGDRLAVALSSEDLVVETGGTGATVTVHGDGRDARSDFPRRRFSADYRAGTLHVRTDPERGSWSGRRASYTVVVRVPDRMEAELSLASGDVRVGAFDGGLRLETASGDVEVEGVEGAAVRITAASGDVRAGHLGGADVLVETASGDVEVAEIAGRSVALHTASGDLQVGPVGADRLQAHTASGDVALGRLDVRNVEVNTASGDVAFALERAAPVAVSTGSGDVTLTLPAAGFEVALNSGSITIADGLDFQGRRGRRSADGRLGAGGPRLAVSTGGGAVTLRSR